MRQVLCFAVVVAVCCMAGYVYAQVPEIAQAPLEFGGVVTDVASAQMIVKALDKETRMITLTDANGEGVIFKAGSEVRNFDQIAVGDKVNIDYMQSISILVGGQGMAPSRTETMEIERAPLGEKPVGVATKTTDITGVVEAVDYDNAIVTLKGPQKTIAVRVDKNAENLKNLKVGDNVNLSFTEQLAISVTK